MIDFRLRLPNTEESMFEPHEQGSWAHYRTMGYNRGEKIPGYRGYIPGERPTTSADPITIGAFFSFADC